MELLHYWYYIYTNRLILFEKLTNLISTFHIQRISIIVLEFEKKMSIGHN